MAASLEHQVICKIIETQDFHSVEKLKITEDFFFATECKQVFKYLWNHFHQHETFGQVPSWQIVQSVYDNFPVMQSQDSLTTLCEQLRLAKMRLELLHIADKIQERADFNPREGLKFLRESAATLSSSHELTNDLSLCNAYDVLLKEYNLVSSGKGLTGLPWPWLELNEETQGIHPGEFIPLYGRPKNMKTWTALYVALVLNVHANARVLVYSLEMSPTKIVKRAAALRAVVNYSLLTKGKLQDADYYRFFEQLKLLQLEAQTARDSGTGMRSADFLVTAGQQGSGGVSFLHSKIREFRPDFVLVDGMYLMVDDRQRKRTVDWKAVAHISQDLKMTATDFNIPIMATCQANRKAEKNIEKADLEEIAYADAIGQSADFTIRVHKRKDPVTKEPELVLGFPGSRETDLDAFLIHGIPALNFSFKSRRVKQQEEEGEGKKKGSKPPPTIPTTRLKGT
jgi:replicative DNA helicase